LGFNLFYRDHCPASYEPRGFTSCIDENINFPGDPALIRKSSKTSGLVAGAYRVGVAVSHVDSEEGQNLLHIIPENMNYSIKGSRLGEYQAKSAEENVYRATPSSQTLPAISQSSASSNIMASPAAPSTQTQDDIRTKEALQRMQRSSSRPRDLVPTQTLVNADNLEAGDINNPDQTFETALENQMYYLFPGERVVTPAKMAELIIHAKAVQERFPPTDQPFDQISLDNYKINRKQAPDTVKCECLDNYSGEDMMVCFYSAHIHRIPLTRLDAL
jgi:hypothetical protein